MWVLSEMRDPWRHHGVKITVFEGDLVDLDLEDSKDYVWPDLSHPLASSNEFHLKIDRTPYGLTSEVLLHKKEKAPHSIIYTQIWYII